MSNFQSNDDRIMRGMVAQLKLRAIRLQADDTSLGWKIGFGAPAALEKLKIQAPLIGFLTAKILIPSNITVALNSFKKAVVEPEIAVHMGANLAAGANRETAQAAIAGLGPAIELADLDFPPEDVERILSKNIYQRNVILGPMDASRKGARLNGLSATLCKDATVIAHTTDMQANTGNIIDLVRGVADCLAGFDLTLRAGEVVIVGSVVPPVFVDEPCAINFKLKPFDDISVHFK